MIPFDTVLSYPLDLKKISASFREPEVVESVRRRTNDVNVRAVTPQKAICSRSTRAQVSEMCDVAIIC